MGMNWGRRELRVRDYMPSAMKSKAFCHGCGNADPGLDIGVSTHYCADFFAGNYQAAAENVCGLLNSFRRVRRRDPCSVQAATILEGLSWV